MADYNSSHTGAVIDAAVVKAAKLPTIAWGDGEKSLKVKSDESGYEVVDEYSNSEIDSLISAAVSAAVAAAVPVGAVKTFAGLVADLPSGYLHMNGQAVSRTTYSDLFTAIGTIWGVGDGSTTFNLPPASKFILGSDGDAGSFPPGTIGDGSGSVENHTLVASEMPSHVHYVSAGIAGAGYGQPAGGSPASGGNTGSAGSDGAHNHSVSDYKPVHAAMVFMIKY